MQIIGKDKCIRIGNVDLEPIDISVVTLIMLTALPQPLFL